jgi:hypothetical protein
MKKYDKNYEDVFSARRSLKKCPLDKLDFLGYSLDEYKNIYNDFLRGFFDSVFDAAVKHYWLSRHFGLGDRYIAGSKENSILLDAAFSIFLRQYVGIDYRIFSRWFLVNRIVSYFKDFFPDMMDHDPFREPEYFRFPFKHITLDFLAMVYQMDERLDLIREAEEKGMNINVFMDFVINYSLSYNDDNQREKYQIVFPNSRFSIYVKNMDLPVNQPKIKKKKRWKRKN